MGHYEDTPITPYIPKQFTPIPLPTIPNTHKDVKDGDYRDWVHGVNEKIEAEKRDRRFQILDKKIQTAKQTSDGSSTDYYKLPEGAKDIIDLIEHRNMNFSIGNIFKACFRLGQKDGNDDLYDLRKIKFFVEREITRLSSPV